MKIQLRLFLALAMISLLGLAACGTDAVGGPDGPCSTEARVSVSVKVVNSTGAAVSDATLTFSVNGAAAQNCENRMDGSYVCGLEQAGSITVTATKGADTKTQTVTIKKTPEGCHVDGQSITITLGA